MNPIMRELLLQHSYPWLAVIGLPILLALAVLHPRSRLAALWIAPWAALPALALALIAVPGQAVEIPWLLLGMRLGMDATAKVFLLFTALLWTCAGVYAKAYLEEDAALHRFFAFFLITMSGNLGLIIAQDIASFYFFFALMSFAAYGLVVHDGTSVAMDAGKIYLSLVVLGEVLLISALLLMAGTAGWWALQEVPASVAGAERRDLIIGLTLAGFGVKVGALPLHVWLPLAHPVAPTPASAVLSGTMIKAGLLGWLRFLPLGEAVFPTWGILCLVAGLGAAFYGVGVGLTQRDPKTVLAYSSISQMGFITLAVGGGFLVPEAWPAALAAVLLYALHHALAKGALFLGVGVARGASGERWPYTLILAGLLLPALALAGAPLTSGALAKVALKRVTGPFPAPWPAWLDWFLPLAAVGTSLLMGRFLLLMWSSSKAEHAHLKPRLWLPWAALLLGVATIPWVLIPDDLAGLPGEIATFDAIWPIIIGALLIYGLWRWGEKVAVKMGLQIPAGDLLVLVSWLAARVSHYSTAPATMVLRRWYTDIQATKPRRVSSLEILAPLVKVEGYLGRWISIGVLFLLLAASLFGIFSLA